MSWDCVVTSNSVDIFSGSEAAILIIEMFDACVFVYNFVKAKSGFCHVSRFLCVWTHGTLGWYLKAGLKKTLWNTFRWKDVPTLLKYFWLLLLGTSFTNEIISESGSLEPKVVFRCVTWLQLNMTSRLIAKQQSGVLSQTSSLPVMILQIIPFLNAILFYKFWVVWAFSGKHCHTAHTAYIVVYMPLVKEYASG